MKTRILVAAAGLPVLLVVLLALPSIATSIAIALLCAIAAWELLWKTGILHSKRLVALGVVLAAGAAMWSCFGFHALAFRIGLYVLMVLIIAELLHDKSIGFESAACLFVAALVIPVMFSAIARLRAMELGRFYVLLPFVVTFSGDSGAYFVGRAWGKHKLAPITSPKKTVEGAVGGVVCAMVVMVIYGLVVTFAFQKTFAWIPAMICALVGALMAIFGDLAFSHIKRQHKIKDYSNLLPGHGGVLDRFDSTIFVAPLVELVILLFPLVR
ncbi:MAG: CDP-archaeol synthase [Ruminococcaceae bacterium]|nr:CDP-archaeol synthase [Oscillospiraceae bacterium]